MGTNDETSHWEVESGAKRADVIELELARFNGLSHIHNRVEKFNRMSESPFAFYRGTAHLFFRDLASRGLPLSSPFANSQSRTWIQGDLHLNNFGVFRDGEGDIVFDLNDFDESWVACYLYDLWRGAVSMLLTAWQNGFEQDQSRIFVIEFCNAYIRELERARGKEGRNLDKVTIEKAHGPLRKLLEKAQKKKSRKSMLDSWTHKINGVRRFKDEDPELEEVSNDDFRLISSAIAAYKEHLPNKLRGKKAYFKVLDVAKRLGAGVGSLGTPRYYVLIRGRDENPDTCRILDVKEQGLPSFFPFLDKAEQTHLLSVYPEDRAGLRVAHAQQALLMDPDRHLGGISILGHSFSVRERSPFKKSLKVEKLKKFDDFQEMCGHWGSILAAAQARADKDYEDSDLVEHILEEVVIDLVCGKEEAFAQETLAFAEAYAEQVSTDYDLFMQMRKDGRID